MQNKELSKYIHLIGWIGTFTACCMYFFYIPQIWDNLHGHVAQPWQPAAAMVNCTIWVWYGAKVKDWPVAVANAPGIVFGFVAFVTAL
ncbi:SemiSWEET family [Commensalibacter communis]|uniref:SemiSWEET family n=1 Tax=Commensalibacter communis TaxID=2972786 RepID=A0A9W4TPI5_9PROT|nr:hypothetical protein [Commensalibacter communis]CAI3937267.1 SemiSWEET family [Commensalibacter communis]CAI3939170.1 SemiSWEET family [Commensalibacter communis]CAI3940929.1 SemiSWEET family [Commensalibacter communis]CAI3940978.1 SemiSWEET family [Commensalibacter communis]CAI3941176.1 SemiSWEET family [Commensalibacter communis]